MFLGLGHNPVWNGHNEHSGISLASSCDHILDEVPVSWAVHYREVVLGGIEALMGDIDRHASFALFFQAVHNPGELEGCLAL